MLKVLTEPAPLDASVIKPTMALESIPPDKNAPSGTSDIICPATARPSASRSADAAASSVHVRAGTEATSQ